MYFYKKTKYVEINGVPKKQYNIEMIKNKNGIRIIGHNNHKIINKQITFLNNKQINKTKHKKSKHKKTKSNKKK